MIINSPLTSDKTQDDLFLYYYLFKTAPVGLFYFDEKGILLDWNESFEKILGLSREIVQGKDLTALSEPEIVASIKQTLEGQVSYYEGLYRMQDRPSDPLSVKFTCVPVYDDNGLLKGGVGVGEDISYRYMAEKLLKESESKYRAVFEHTGTATLVIEDDGTISMVNSEFESMFGYKKDEVEGRLCWSDMLISEDREMMINYHNLRRVKPEEVPRAYEFRLVDSDGRIRDCINTGTMIPGSSCSVVSVLDISEIKHIQQALKEAGEYRTIFENTGTALIIIDDNMHILMANTEFANLAGIPKEALKDCLWTEFVSDADRAQMMAYHRERRYRPDAAPAAYEFHFISARGIEREISVTVALIPGTRRSIASLLDITDSKNMEKALRESEEKYRTIFENTGTATIMIEEDTTISLLNGEFAKLFGYSKEETEGRRSWTEFVIEQDLERMMAYHNMRRNNTETAPQKYEFVFRDRWGTERDIVVSLALIQGTGRSVASMVDITDRRRAEAELREAKEALEIKVAERTQELSEANQRLEAWTRELERLNQEMGGLNEVSELLQTCRSMDEAYRVVATYAARLFPHCSGGLFMYNESKQLLESKAFWGDAISSQDLFKPDDCWSLRLGRLYLMRGGVASLPCAHSAHQESRPYLCVPMTAQGKVLGLLHVIAPSGLDLESSLQLLEGSRRVAANLSDQISLSFVNLQMQAEMQDLSIKDPLTGLYNRRFLHATLDLEISKALRKTCKIGVIMVDIDHFKAYNDNFGHSAGDAVLIGLARTMNSCIRSGDIVCRYGGEEFVVAMPDTDREAVMERAEKLRVLAAQLSVQHASKELGSITISVGVALYPDHGTSPADLINAADRALYLAKAEGRNCVISAERIPVV